MRLLLVASGGGHLDHLMWLAPWWSQHVRDFVTFPSADAPARLVGERWTPAAWPTNRNLGNAARNLMLARRLVRARRPDVVLTTGAGLGVPFLAAAAQAGVATVFVEVIDRLRRPSLSRRLVAPWVDVVAGFGDGGPGVVDLGPPWVTVASDRHEGDGPWVVLTGTHHQPFRRLVRAANALSAVGIPVWVQAGAAVGDLRAPGCAWASPDHLEVRVQAARGVITHAGPGSWALARRFGHTPFVWPRDPAHGEHVDDHQLRWVRGLTDAIVLQDEADLVRAVGAGVERRGTSLISGIGPQGVLALVGALQRAGR